MNAETPPPAALSAQEALATRRSIRAFRPDPVPHETVEAILALAARAPSGSNIQPWQAIVLTGKPLREFGTALKARSLSGDPGHWEYNYYPQQWREPYLSRRRKVGWDLYASLGIQRGEHDRMAAQHARNYDFFGAPVGMLFTMDRDMEVGSWLDLGMFLQSVMIAARGFGLDTCPQAAFALYAGPIGEMLGIPADRQVICGIALGHADPDAPENRFETVREPVAAFTRFLDG